MKYTDLSEIELIVVANGCTDNTRAYLEYVNSVFDHQGFEGQFIYEWVNESIGYAKACNLGIDLSLCDRVILLNNDTVLLDQLKNQWLDIFDQPFNDPQCGISCITKIHSQPAGHDFAVFFAVAIRQAVFDSIGLLSEDYGVGGGEDTEFCIEAEKAGWKVLEVFEKFWNGHIFTGDFPIYHKGEGTMHDPNLVPDWDNIFHKNSLKLAKKYNPEHYKFMLCNDYERAVFLKGDTVFPREAARYQWASKNIFGSHILEVGCSTGYGRQFLPNDIHYVGIDYDPKIIEVAKEQNWRKNSLFFHLDIQEMSIGQFDTIIAFEVIEHLKNGIEIVEQLKKHCKRLLISIPLNEPPGFWGHHHFLHGLNESHFPGAEFWYIDQNGVITTMVNPDAKFSLLLCGWTNE
jgi:GT2 family glycosyltransferase